MKRINALISLSSKRLSCMHLMSMRGWHLLTRTSKKSEMEWINWHNRKHTGKTKALAQTTLFPLSGANGATWLQSTGDISVPGIAINALDTNGAGDIFSGAVLVGLARGWERERTLSFANAVAASSCQHFGNCTLPTQGEAVQLAVTGTKE